MTDESKRPPLSHVANCTRADPAYGKGVADALVKFATGNSDAPGGKLALAAAN